MNIEFRASFIKYSSNYLLPITYYLYALTTHV